MLYGICNLSIVPLRIEASDASEMVSQVLFGEDFSILEKEKKWSKIRLSFDGYEGYIDNKQYLQIDEETFDKLADSANYYSSEIIDFVTNKKNHLSTIAIGSRLPFYKNQHLIVGSEDYYYDGNVYSEKLDKYEIIQKAFLKVKDAYREAVILRDVQGMSYEEIAEILKVNEGTVKSRINRGRAQLQILLKDIYNE